MSYWRAALSVALFFGASAGCGGSGTAPSASGTNDAASTGGSAGTTGSAGAAGADDDSGVGGNAGSVAVDGGADAGSDADAVEDADAQDSAEACAPTAETCNGADDDCDGEIDEGNPDGGADCSTGIPGECADGVLTCDSGGLKCEPKTPAAAETCDGLDNDCDGAIDNGDPGGGAACATGLLGVCAAGTEHCVSGVIVCGQDVQPSAETCNGLDDDCDGVVDNGDPGGGQPCATGEPGVCAAGTTACASGTIDCIPDATPGAEACDGLDNDCNGSTDDLFYDGFENGTDDWKQFATGWYHLTFDAYQGIWIVRGNATDATTPCAVDLSLFMITDVDLGGATSATFEFAYRASVGSSDRLTVIVSTNGGVSWSTLGTLGPNGVAWSTNWSTKSFDLAPYLGTSTVRFGFRLNNGCGDGQGVDWRIDEVVVRATCT